MFGEEVEPWWISVMQAKCTLGAFANYFNVDPACEKNRLTNIFEIRPSLLVYVIEQTTFVDEVIEVCLPRKILSIRSCLFSVV